MELKAYLRVLIAKWWIVLLVFVITYAATLVFTFRQVPVYQAQATFVAKLDNSLANDRNFASALDTLSRRTEIATTYTTAANSSLLKNMAADELKLTPQQQRDLSVSSQQVAGTNVLQITVQSHDPALARDFANMLGAKTMAYVRDLYETYQLELLDHAVLPNSPIKPNKVLNLTLGAIMGLVLGAGLAFLSAYLQAPTENLSNFAVLDDETGLYNRRYFLHRLRQELSRARRNNYCLSIGLMNIDHQGALGEVPARVRLEALRKVAALSKPELRDEDVVARFGDTLLAFMLPDTPGEQAREAVGRIQARIDASTLDLEQSGVMLNLDSGAAIVAYPDTNQAVDVGPDELLAQAVQALQGATTRAFGTVYLLSEHTNGVPTPGHSPSV